MDTSDWIALGSLAVALGAGVVATLGWHQARRSSDASHASAVEARRAADAAERSAHADERAVELAARAEENLQAPRLDFLTEGGSGQEASVLVLLLSGPPEVDIHTTGVWILDAPEPGQRTTMAVDDRATHVAGTARHLVPVDLRSRTAELVVEVTVDVIGTITTENGATQHTWPRRGRVSFPAPPPGPVSAPAEPPFIPPPGLFRDHGLGQF
jgi:hypothetical protein